MSVDRIFAFAILGSMIAFSVIHLGVSVGIIIPYREYDDIYRPEIGLASFNLVICIISFFGGIAGLIGIGVNAEILGRVAAGLSAVLGVFCIASLITALVINAKSFSYANSRFSRHMNNYQKDADSQRIVDLIQTNSQCCGSNLWIDWARVSLNVNAAPLFTTTTAPMTNFSTPMNTTVPISTVSETTSTTTTAITGENTASTTTTTTTTTDLPISTVSGTTSTTTTAITDENTTSNTTTNTTTSVPISTVSATTSVIATAVSGETTVGNITSTTAAASFDGNNTSSATTMPAMEVETSSSSNATTETTLQVINATTAATKKRRSLNSDGTHVDRQSLPTIDSLRVKRRVASASDPISSFTASLPVVLPRSCCASNAIITNNGSGSYCISNMNGTINAYHVNGCAQKIDGTTGSQAMGFGVINSCLIVISFSAIPLLWKIPTA